MRRLLLYAVLCVPLALAAGATPWVAAQTRAVGVMATTMELDVLAGATRTLTGDPRVEEVEVAGAPTSLFRPAGDGPWPSFVFVNGATQRGREEPTVRLLAEGLARTGHLVAVPDLPGLRELAVSERAAEATVDVALEMLGREDVDEERVGLVGVSIGGTLALLAAEDPRLGGRLAVVTAISPLTDLREALRLATTGHHRLGDRLVRYDVDPFVMEVIQRSFPALGSPGRPHAVDELLANDDPERFDELYEALPRQLRGPLERLSPMRQAGELDVRVEAATGPHDDYFPPDQVERLAERAPDARLTLTRVLDHADLALRGGGPMDALRFNRVVVRSLVEARS